MRRKIISLLLAGVFFLSLPITKRNIVFKKKKTQCKIRKYKSNEQKINDLLKKSEHNKRIKEVDDKLDKEIKKRKQKEKKEIEIREREKHKKSFVLTFYTAAAEENGGNSSGVTASGKIAKAGRTIAVPKNIPFGSKIIINGNTYIAEDTGNDNYICELDDGSIRLDVFVDNKEDIPKEGIVKVEGYLYLKGEC